MEIWGSNAMINRKWAEPMRNGRKRERQRNRDTKSVSEIEKEINLCRETPLRMCKDPKRCEHKCIMPPSAWTATLATAGALWKIPVTFNLISVINEAVNKGSCGGCQ